VPPFPGFVGPSYTNQSVKSECQTTLNWLPERDEVQPGKFSMFPTPGLKVAYNIVGATSVRQQFEINGRAFTIAGTSFVELFANGTQITRGTVISDGTPAQMTGNPQQVLMTSAGNPYVFILGTNTFQRLAIPNGGSSAISRVAFSDGFFIALQANSAQWFVSALEDATNWDPLNTTIVSVFPDNIVSLIVDHRDIWIFGRKITTVYYDSGNVFPFDVLPSGTIEQGCIAMNTPVKLDNSVFWLGGDERGAGIVWRLQGYTPSRISTHAIEFAIQNYSTISDAIGYAYQAQGHAFYVLYFPTANKTWVYDVSTNMWHERAFFSGGNYTAHRSQNHVFAFGKHLVGDWNSGNIYEMNIAFVDDFGNQIRRVRRAPHIEKENKWFKHVSMEVNLESGLGFPVVPVPPKTLITYTLTATQVGPNMNYVLSSNISAFPLTSSFTIPVNPVPGSFNLGQLFLLAPPITNLLINGATSGDHLRFFSSSLSGAFSADHPITGSDYNLAGPPLYSGLESAPTMLAGTFVLNQYVPTFTPSPAAGEVTEPQINLRWSDDGGHSWSNEYSRGVGFAGDYKERVIWRRLGRSRNRVYEVNVSDSVPWKIVEAYLDVQPGNGA
jgi:hypothetical protein